MPSTTRASCLSTLLTLRTRELRLRWPTSSTTWSSPSRPASIVYRASDWAWKFLTISWNSWNSTTWKDWQWCKRKTSLYDISFIFVCISHYSCLSCLSLAALIGFPQKLSSFPSTSSLVGSCIFLILTNWRWYLYSQLFIEFLTLAVCFSETPVIFSSSTSLNSSIKHFSFNPFNA